MNALNAQVQDEIADAAATVTADAGVAAVVLYGGERVFAAGADIKEMADMSYAQMAARSAALQASFTAVARIPSRSSRRSLATRSGGGLELALCADFRVLRRVGEGGAAGDPARHHPRRGRHAATAPADRAVEGEGPDLQRTACGGVGGAGDRAGRQGCPGRRGVLGGAVARRAVRGGPALALRAAKQAVDGGLRLTWRPGWRSSGCSSRRCSPPRTRDRDAQLHGERAGEGDVLRSLRVG